MERRTAAFFGVVMLGLLICVLSVYSIASGDSLAEAAQKQSVYRLTVAQTRGTVYDCNLLPLTCETDRWVAAVAPGVQTAADLSRALGNDGVASLASLLADGRPFALSLPSNVSGDGILTFQIPDRYGGEALAPHTIGYLDGSGRGVAGIEKAYDEFLSDQCGEISVTYHVDALNRAIASLEADTQGEVAVVAVQSIGQDPDFDQDDVAAVLEDESSPLMNRCLAAYSVGSVFKIVSAAAALEAGLPPDTSFTCTGSVEVSGDAFRCYDSEAHGAEDMRMAIANSCNTYFISLMQQVDPSLFLDMARRFGFGSAVTLAPGYTSSAGVLPSESSLAIPKALANFSFGQGELTATPLQIAAMVNAVVSGGEYAAPSLVERTVDANLSTLSEARPSEPVRTLSAYNAALLKNFMLASVTEGTSQKYAPEHGGAGAKTATAHMGGRSSRITAVTERLVSDTRRILPFSSFKA